MRIFFLRAILRLSLCAACMVPALLAAGPIDDLADETWLQVDSRHFKIITDQPEATARRLLTDLESLRYISTRVRDVETLEMAPPLTILAIGGRGNFARLGLRDSIGGVFNITRNGYSALANVAHYGTSTDESTPARTILLHEYHHFLMRLTPATLAMPMWYDEGMAEYWSSLTIEDGYASFGRAVDGMHREAFMFNGGGSLSIDTEQLFNLTRLKNTGTITANDDIGRFYAQARYAVHYFLSTKELRAQLERYIALYNLGIGQHKAAQLAFGKPYAELNKDILRYLRRKMVVRGYKIGKDGLDFPPVEMRVTALDRRAVWSAFAKVLPRYAPMNPKLAQGVLTTNRKLNPDDPDAYRLHFIHAGPEGQPDLEALTQRFPKHAGLLATHGESLRLYGEAMRASGVDGWTGQLQKARAVALRAYQADPSLALPFYSLGQIHHALPGNEGLADGIAAMDTATIYERDAQTFSKLARMYLRAGKAPEALASMRSAVAFLQELEESMLDIALLENLEMLHGPVAAGATITATGLAWPDGASYTGNVRDKKPAGSGRYTRLNGSYYEGPFEDGLPHGQGKLVSDSGMRYEGRFERGVARGAGRLVFPAGGPMLSYQGQVEHALPSGAGVFVTSAGSYDGQFQEGAPHGPVTFTRASGAKVSGTWRFGKLNWPAAADVLFTGGVSSKGERHGNGWCRPVDNPTEFSLCEYRDGKRVD